MFEMLGNFSFGAYFKREAIKLAWDLLTIQFKIPTSKLWVTVFEEDDEAAQLWIEVAGVSPDRVQRLGAKDNFWSMGETGPCGPCSEIFFDHGEAHGPSGGPATESDRYVEIWNLVFMQFNRDNAGKLTPLPKPSIDTGMGLERIAAVMQGVYSNYETDIFVDLLSTIANLSGQSYGTDSSSDMAMRVIADHSRAAAFLIADGVMPSNVSRGYVLRRIMRRAIRFGVKIGLDEPFFHNAVAKVIEIMGEAHPSLIERQSFIHEVVKGEEHRFRQTLSKGLILLEESISNLGKDNEISGDVAFQLYDTFGFPIDLTELIATERGVSIDMDGFNSALKNQQNRSRQAHKGSGSQSISSEAYALASRFSTTFMGYTHNSVPDCLIQALLNKTGDEVDRLTAGDVGVIITDKSPMYAESGGQIGDTGVIATDQGAAIVTDTKRPIGSVLFHHVEVNEGLVKVGDTINVVVNSQRRDQIRLNHTATHLLHASLRQILGEHVMQKGSLVDENRLRFDFSHHKAMTATEIRAVEESVYAQILANTPVTTDEMAMEDAIAKGAMALFDEKYADQVRVVSVSGFSIELCGGTHVKATGDIGMFRITSESGVAAGIRRIEAVTGMGAWFWTQRRDDTLSATAQALKTHPDSLSETVSRLVEERKRLERELDSARADLARVQAEDLTASVREIDGINVLAAEMNADGNTMRNEAERLRDTLGTAVVVLGSRESGSVKLVVMVSKDIAGKRVHAGKLIKAVAEMVGGGGGGRPDMAQAGGKNPDALPDALGKVYELI